MLRVMMHRIDQPLIGIESVSCAATHARDDAPLIALLQRMMMHRVDQPLIGIVNISSSLRCCSFFSCTYVVMRRVDQVLISRVTSPPRCVADLSPPAHGDAPRIPASDRKSDRLLPAALIMMFVLLLRMVMRHVDHQPLIDRVTISSSLRCCSFSVALSSTRQSTALRLHYPLRTVFDSPARSAPNALPASHCLSTRRPAAFRLHCLLRTVFDSPARSTPIALPASSRLRHAGSQRSNCTARFVLSSTRRPAALQLHCSLRSVFDSPVRRAPIALVGLAPAPTYPHR